MNFVEYGPRDAETILLLHGGGLSWWNYRKAAELLGETYHVILPILDGHGGSDQDFSGIEENAEEILRLVDQRCGGQVLLMGGVSLGAQILLEALAKRNDVCRYAVIESAAVFPSELLASLIGPAVSGTFALIQKRWFARMQFRYLRMDPELFEEYYRDSCAITRKNMIAFLEASLRWRKKGSLASCKARCLIVAGEREQRSVKRSAEHLHAILPESVLEIKKGWYHGEFSMNHPEEYVQALRDLIRGT